MDISGADEAVMCVTIVSVPVPCASNEYRCIDGSCISLTLRCNSRRDCAGGEDEYDCRKCLHNLFNSFDICREVTFRGCVTLPCLVFDVSVSSTFHV